MGAPHDNSSSLRPPRGVVRLIGWSVAVILVFAVSVGLVWAHSLQIRSQQVSLQGINALGPSVLVMRVQQRGHSRSVSLPASIHGYIETPIYAKTPGYLKAIYVDKGDRVHKGEVLAILDSPELDKQVADAKANYWLSKVTDGRNQELVAQQVIPQQTADNSHAAMLQARAAYEQLVALQSYEVIRAETDGIITARDVDPGALIPQVTTPGSSISIVDLATLYPLRVYADVPQDLAALVKDGELASVSVTQYPDRSFSGTVTRHPEALAQDTRTMRVEVDLPNKDSALYPGMYATLTLNVGSSDIAPWVPDDALMFRGGDAFVPVVRKNRIHLARVALGNDDGREVQVASGLSKDDLIAVNVGQGVEEGDPVQPVVQ
jgi:membrane fusion protein, multidrug efflux system